MFDQTFKKYFKVCFLKKVLSNKYYIFEKNDFSLISEKPLMLLPKNAYFFQ